MRLGQRLALNVGLLAAGRAGGLALSAITLAALTRILGPEGFGRYTFAIVFTSFFTALADQGPNTIIARAMKRDPQAIGHVLGNALVLKLLMGLGAAGLAIAAAELPMFAADTRFLVVLASGLIVTTALSVANVVFQVQLATGFVVLGDMVARACFLVLAWLLLRTGGGVAAVLVAQVGTALLGLLVVLGATWRRVSPSFRIDLRLWRALLVPAAPLILAYVLGMVYFRFDAALLAVVKGDRAVGIYGVAFRVIDLCLLAPGLIMPVVFPVLVECYEHDRAALDRTFQRLQDVMALLSLPLAIFLAMESGLVVGLVGGARFLEAGPSLALLAWGMAAMYLSNAMGFLLIAGGRERWSLLVPLVGAPLNVGLNLLLIPRFGVMGAAWTSVATQAVVLGLAATLTRRLIGVTPWPGAWKEMLLACAVVLAALLVVNRFQPNVLLAAGAGSASFAIALGLTPRVRREVAALFSSRAEAVVP